MFLNLLYNRYDYTWQEQSLLSLSFCVDELRVLGLTISFLPWPRLHSWQVCSKHSMADANDYSQANYFTSKVHYINFLK